MLGRSRVALWCLLVGCAGGPISDFPVGAVGNDNEGAGPDRGPTGEEAPSESDESGDGDDGDDLGSLPPTSGGLDAGTPSNERPCGGSSSDAGVSDGGVCSGDECPVTRSGLDEAMVPGGACVSSADLDLVCDGEIRSVIGACNESSLIESAGFGQVENCALTDPALSTASEACVDCYLEANRCTLVNCLAECLAPTTAAACNACREQNCGAALRTCTGLPAL